MHENHDYNNNHNHPVENYNKPAPHGGFNFNVTKFQVLVGAIVAFMGALIPGVISYQSNNNDLQRIQNELYLETRKLDAPAQAIKDSLIVVAREDGFKRESEEALNKYIEIHEIMETLADNLTNVNLISVWKIHDHGGILNTAEQQYITILYSKNGKYLKIDVKKDFDKRELSIGKAWFANEMRMNGYYIVHSMDEKPEFYTGQAKEYSIYIGDKSIVGIYIKGEENALYFLTVSFNERFPENYNNSLEIKIINAKVRLERLISKASQDINK